MLSVEIDHEYSDGGFAVSFTAGAAAQDESLADTEQGRPPVFILENDSILRRAEGWASGEVGSKLWDNAAGLPLASLQESELGDWAVTLLDAGGDAGGDARPNGAVRLSNRYFGSQLLLGADGTLVWLSNPLANKAVVSPSLS